MSENVLFLTLFPLYKSDFPSQFDEEKHSFQSSLGKKTNIQFFQLALDNLKHSTSP